MILRKILREVLVWLIILAPAWFLFAGLLPELKSIQASLVIYFFGWWLLIWWSWFAYTIYMVFRK